MWKKRSKAAPAAVGAGEPRPDVYRGGFRTFQARASGPADKMRLASADMAGAGRFRDQGFQWLELSGRTCQFAQSARQWPVFCGAGFRFFLLVHLRVPPVPSTGFPPREAWFLPGFGLSLESSPLDLWGQAIRVARARDLPEKRFCQFSA